MKYILSLFLFFVTNMSFSQNCISSYTGVYRVDIQATMPFFEKTAYAEDGVLPDDFRSMVEGISLIIYNDSLSLEMMGNKRVLAFTDRKSIKEAGSCDLLLDMSDMAVPEEANAMFLTLFQKKNKLLQIVNSIESKEMDSYIWVKVK